MALLMIRIAIPSKPYFDELHYLPAARSLLELAGPANREHPLLGKELIGAGIALFGDRPFGWRIFPALAGCTGLFAFMRAMWFATYSRLATLTGGILLATAFPLFVQSRIAMLDPFMMAFTLIALWQCAGAVREPETGRIRLASAGIALGCAMASKWNAVPVAMLPGIAFLAIRLKTAGTNFLTIARGPPIPGMSLIEAALWLGVLPLLIYAATFAPTFFYRHEALTPAGLIEFHKMMWDLHSTLKDPHPYQSQWPQWIANLRPIWYLYEQVDGAQRGVLLIGNPFTMLAGLPALLWCAWMGIFRRNWPALAVVVLYAASLGIWVFAAKPVQFYYHYALPGIFLIAALALALDALWRSNASTAIGNYWTRGVALAVVAISIGLFAYFYPILSAAPLPGEQGFATYTWLDSWR